MSSNEEYVDALYSALRSRDVKLTYTELEDSLREAAAAQLDSLDKLSKHWQKSTDDESLAQKQEIAERGYMHRAEPQHGQSGYATGNGFGHG